MANEPKEGDKMNDQNLINKLFEVIKESITSINENMNNSCDQIDSGAATLTDDIENEHEIKRLCRDFAKTLNDRNYEQLDGRAEYHLYTVDHLIELIKNNDEQNTIKLFNENKIISKFEDCEFLKITLSEDKEQAEVIYNVRTCIISAEDKYFKSLNKKNNKKMRISEGTPFTNCYTLAVKKEKGVWKIDEFESSDENII